MVATAIMLKANGDADAGEVTGAILQGEQCIGYSQGTDARSRESGKIPIFAEECVSRAGGGRIRIISARRTTLGENTRL